jgi:hypothetical protein
MSQQNINLDVLDEQLRTVEVDLGLLNTDSNDGLHQVPSTSSGVMNDFIIISDKPISQEVVEEIGMPEPTNEQKAIKLKFLEELQSIYFLYYVNSELLLYYTVIMV